MGNTRYIYIIYDKKTELYMAEFYTLWDVSKFITMTKGSIKTAFSKSKSNEIKTNRFIVYRQKIVKREVRR